MGVKVGVTMRPFQGWAEQKEKNVARSEEQQRAAVKMKMDLGIPLTQRDYEIIGGGAMGAELMRSMGGKQPVDISQERAEKALRSKLSIESEYKEPKAPPAPKTFTVNEGGQEVTYERTYDKTTGKYVTKKLGSGPKFKETGKEDDDKVLSPSDAERLGVPYGTTAGQAAKLEISPMSASGRKEITSFGPAKAIVDKIDELSKKIITAEGAWGAAGQGISNIYGSFTKTNSDAVMYDKMKEGLISLLTRAMGEKGVLTNEDINRVRSLLPTFRDTAEVRERSIGELRALMDEMEERTKKALTEPITSSKSKPDPLGIR